MIPSQFFEDLYRKLRRPYAPMKWMTRMFQMIIDGRPPSVVDIPTGSGKTDLIVIWLIALAWYGKNRNQVSPIPRRLLWVVNRRVLVQQVHELAEKLRTILNEQKSEATSELRDALRSLNGIGDGEVLRIVQLRGQRLDDREWSLFPTQPQLIVGTVDQIGSRLLFQGYGQGKWSRPLQAGLLGIDAWVCIDEAHLVPSFAVTLRQIREQMLKITVNVPTPISGLFATLPSWFTELSATPGLLEPRLGSTFRLDVSKGEESDELIVPRILARDSKRVTWKQLADPKKLAEAIASEAIRIAKQSNGHAIAVYCSKANDAEKVAKEIEKKQNYPGRVLRVTGRMRGYERDRLEKDNRFLRFKASHAEEMTAEKPPTFLVGTSAAEVGLDANASAIVCDFGSLITLTQRIGRLDRRGELSAKAQKGDCPVPTMTIVGGQPGNATDRQLNVLADRLRGTFHTLREFDAKHFTGAHWAVVIGKDKSETPEEPEEIQRLEKHQLCGDDIVNPDGIIEKLKASDDAFSSWLACKFASGNLDELDADALAAEFNRIIESEIFYEESRFAQVTLSDTVKNKAAKNPRNKALFELNKQLLQEVYKSEFSPDSKHGADDAVMTATWRVLGLPLMQQNNLSDKTESGDFISEDMDLDNRIDHAGLSEEIEAQKPAKWLQHQFASITAGPIVVPPLGDATLGRWAATSPQPSQYLPVHPWLYGLLPDDEGTPLVGVAFRLELDVLAHQEDGDEEDDKRDAIWKKVKTVLTKFPPLRSEFHLAPLYRVREWLEQLQEDNVKLAHYDGETWDNSIDPKRLTANSAVVLPTSCTFDQMKMMQLAEIIPSGTKENEYQPLWDVFNAMAGDGARYIRHVEVTKSNVRAINLDPVYRVNLENTGTAILGNETCQPPTNEWKCSRLKLDFDKGGIRFTLRYFQRNRDGEVAYLPLHSHLRTAGDYAEALAKSISPDNTILSAILKAAACDHDLGKDHDKWQRAMGNTRTWREGEGLDDSARIAKPVTDKPANAGGYRHEWGSLMKVNDKPRSFPKNLPIVESSFYRDLYLHLIAAHHGYFRPSLPDRGFDSPPTPATQNLMRLECIERTSRLQKHLGYWRLAYLEGLLKIVDVAASRGGGVDPLEEIEDIDES